MCEYQELQRDETLKMSFLGRKVSNKDILWIHRKKV